MEVKLVEDLINSLKKRFRELVVTRANNNSFWGMNINITDEKNVDMYMKEQFMEATEAFG